MFNLFVRYDYDYCESCNTLFQVPMPEAPTIASFYPASYKIYDENTRKDQIGRLRRALLYRTKGYHHLKVGLLEQMAAAILSPFKQVSIPEFIAGGKMLDVGCGNGRYLLTMRQLGWQVQGVEFSADGVRACQMSDLPVHHGDLASAQFEDNAFDLITAHHVIEHVPEPDVFMAELARILKPGGRLVIETPNVDALGRPWFGANWYANDVPRHLILFSPKSLGMLGERHSLGMLSLEQETSQKIFLNSIDYAIGNHGKPSRKIGWRRLLARLYVMLAKQRNQGDKFRMILTKPL